MITTIREVFHQLFSPETVPPLRPLGLGDNLSDIRLGRQPNRSVVGDAATEDVA